MSNDLLWLDTASKLPPYGIPRSGIVSIIDPWRDLYGRNILPVNSENFQTGWTKQTGVTTATVTENQPDPLGGNNAYRVQTTGGTMLSKYYITVNGASNPHTTPAAVLVKVLSGNFKITSENVISSTVITPANGWVKATITTNNESGSKASLGFATVANADPLDILVYQPQVNIGQLYPYAPPAGLPQSTLDYSGHGNTFQLGSAVGADTNDPAWNGGLVFGTDDYCKSSSPAFDDMQAFTCITVCKANSFGGGSAGRIWDKGTKMVYYQGKVCIDIFRDTGIDVWRGDTTSVDAGIAFMQGISFVPATPNTAPKMYINSIKQTTTRMATYTGNALSDASKDLYVGNNADAIRNFDGTIYLQLWYNRVLSDAEYMSAYNGLRRLMSARGVVI